MALIRPSKSVLRRDWFCLAALQPDGSFKDLPTRHHHMCSTCVGEYERHAGHFESEGARQEVGDVTVLPPKQLKRHEGRYEFCCVCGAAAETEAVFEMEPNQHRCDGLHEQVPEEE